MRNRCTDVFVLLWLSAGAAPLVTRAIDSGTAVRLGLAGDGSVTGVLLAPLGPESRVVVITPPPQRDPTWRWTP